MCLTCKYISAAGLVTGLTSSRITAGARLGHLVWGPERQIKSSIPERRRDILQPTIRTGFCISCFRAELTIMVAQGVGVEPTKLGPPHTAIGLVFSVLFGNVDLSLYSTSSLCLLDGHYDTTATVSLNSSAH